MSDAVIHCAETAGDNYLPDVIVARHWHGPTPTLLGETVQAEVNDSRWIVRCVCNGAQLASKTERRFFCVDCGRGWVSVTWPKEAAGIEAALVVRPVPHTRSWVPGQSVADLVAENDQHGVAA